jgi:hypothetical protein
MNYFYSNDITDYIIDENNNKLEFDCMQSYGFHASTEHKCIVMQNGSNGYIPPMKEIRTITEGLLKFINSYNQDDIDKFNKKVTEDYLKRCEESQKSIKTERKNYAGYVYFICDNMNHVKIGHAKDLESRYKTYTEMPYDPKIIHTLFCSDRIKVGAYFHDKFKTKRFKGEWFNLSDKDIKYIKSGRYSEEIMNYISQ